MKPLLVSLIVSIGAVGACKTTGAESRDVPDEIVESDTDVDGPFEIAQAWLTRAPSDEAVAELAGQWTSPWIERMHRSANGYEVLVLGEGSDDGVLLTIEDDEVTGADIVASDYLWPSK